MSNQDALNNLAILSEILVDVSKSHITPSEAIEDIRKLDISSIYKVMSKQTELFGLYKKLLKYIGLYNSSTYCSKETLNDLKRKVKDTQKRIDTLEKELKEELEWLHMMKRLKL